MPSVHVFICELDSFVFERDKLTARATIFELPNVRAMGEGKVMLCTESVAATPPYYLRNVKIAML